MLGLQLGLGWRWERTALTPACTGPTATAQSTTPHVQVPVLDVELLHLKCQASRMSLQPREGELATVRACAETAGHPLWPGHRRASPARPRAPGRLSSTEGKEGQALGMLPAPEAQWPWGTWCETTPEQGEIKYLLGIGPGLTHLQRLSGAQGRRGSTLIPNPERCPSGHTPAAPCEERVQGMAWQHQLLLCLMSLLQKAGRSRLSSAQGTSSPTDIFATHLLLHHPGGKDLLNDIGIILRRLLGRGEQSTVFPAHRVAWPLAWNGCLLLAQPTSRAGRASTAGSGRVVLGEPLLGVRVQVLPAQLHSPSACAPQASKATALSSLAVWVLPTRPGQPERVASVPEKRRELGRFCPETQGRKYTKTCTSAPSHSPWQISDLPWHLYNPVVLDGPKGPRRAGRGAVGPYHWHPLLLPPAHGHRTRATAPQPHQCPCNSSWQAQSAASFPP